MPAYLLFVLFMSYIGSGFFGGRNLIIFPHDSLLFIVVTAVFYFVGVALGIKSVEYLKNKNNNIKNIAND